jgi:structural maintenance of chromosome 1
MEKFKSKSGSIEVDINEIKKKISQQNKDLNEFRKKVSNAEAKCLEKKLERHRILKQSKLDLIDLPMHSGSMDDISEEEYTGTQAIQPSASDTDSLAAVLTMDSQNVFERESHIKLDFRKLKSMYTNLTQEEIDRTEVRLFAEINEIKELLKNFQMPNQRVDEKLDTVKEMWENTNAEFDKARLNAKKARNAFVKVKDERNDRFQRCYEHISNKIDDIYKSLCMNQGAQASLVLENAEEPYLDGIIYNCVAPGKRFRQMDHLSGGEKTVAALGLLFAIRSYNPSPFFVLDEVDAALDNTNISKVANYIMEQSKKGLQCIVISLKEEFFQHADALIGVYPELNECITSKILSLDLTKYIDE